MSGKYAGAMKKLGLIAGMGDLPKAVAAEAKAKGYHVLAIALESLADPALSSFVDDIKWMNVGKLGLIIEALKGPDIRDAVLAGKVPKALLYKSRIVPDLRAMKLLFSLKDRNDDTILKAVVEEVQKDGINIMNITDFCSDILTPEGILTEEGISENEWKDIYFGWKIAKEMGRLDIGQSVVVKNGAVMAVEAIEGTDEAIKRGGNYAGEGAIVVKVSKPSQDMRFDVPVVGLDTLRSMVEAKARVLAIEAGNSILLQRESFLRQADEACISVVGFKNGID